MRRLSEDAAINIVETADIGGTNMVTPWVKLDNFDQYLAMIQIGASLTDPVTTFKLQQDKLGAGADVKDLTTSGTGKQFDSANLDQDAGDQAIIECRGEDLDINNGFHYVRAIAACAANTGVDNVSLIGIRSTALYPQKYQAGTAPASNEMMYVNPKVTAFS